MPDCNPLMLGGMSGEHPDPLTVLRTLIQATGLSRRKAFDAIRQGRVAVDGQTVTDPSAPFDGGELSFDYEVLRTARPERVYLLLNKPADVITASSDAHGRRTVLDLVPAALRVPGLHAVGRLDLDTSGLLLLTNDGDFTFHLTHPSHEIEKEYWLTSRPPLDERALQGLRAGVEIDGRRRRPAEVRRLDADTDFETAIVIREGRKRQVKRMVEAVGSRVLRLMRVREGSLKLGDLREGGIRRLSAAEVRWLLESGPAATRARDQASDSGRRRPASGQRPRG